MTKFIGAVEPHMEVVGADGQHVGTVDHQEGPDRIKLTRDDGGHRYLNWDWVDRVEGSKLHLNLAANELRQAWERNPDAHIR